MCSILTDNGMHGTMLLDAPLKVLQACGLPVKILRDMLAQDRTLQVAFIEDRKLRLLVSSEQGVMIAAWDRDELFEWFRKKNLATCASKISGIRVDIIINSSTRTRLYQ